MGTGDTSKFIFLCDHFRYLVYAIKNMLRIKQPKLETHWNVNIQGHCYMRQWRSGCDTAMDPLT